LQITNAYLSLQSGMRRVTNFRIIAFASLLLLFITIAFLSFVLGLSYLPLAAGLVVIVVCFTFQAIGRCGLFLLV